MPPTDREPDVLTADARDRVTEAFAANNNVECEALPVVLGALLSGVDARKDLTTAVQSNGTDIKRLHQRVDSISDETVEKLSTVDLDWTKKRVLITNIPTHAFRSILFVMVVLIYMHMRGVTIEDMLRTGRDAFGTKASAEEVEPDAVTP